MKSRIKPHVLDLLARIERGETGFSAAAGGLADPKDFPSQLSDLKWLQKQGYIEILDLDRSSTDGRGSYVAALVSLTDKGRRFLAAMLEAAEKRAGREKV